MGKYGRTLGINERIAFVASVEMGLPMKVLKRRFGMTKEEIEANINLLDAHKKFIAGVSEVDKIKMDNSLSVKERLIKIREQQEKIHKDWKDAHDRLQ